LGTRLLPGFVPRPALALAVLLGAALAAVGALELGSGSSGGARLIEAEVTGLPGTAQLRVTSGHGELIVHRLPAPAVGHIYEVWLQRAHRAPSPTSALFSVTTTGSADVGVPGSLRGVQVVMVTQERLGGSLVPTRPPVILARLS
jgi:hypothetical protein